MKRSDRDVELIVRLMCSIIERDGVPGCDAAEDKLADKASALLLAAYTCDYVDELRAEEQE